MFIFYFFTSLIYFFPPLLTDYPLQVWFRISDWNSKAAKLDKSKRLVYTLYLYLNKFNLTAPRNGKEAKSDKSKQSVYTLHLSLNESNPTALEYSLKAIIGTIKKRNWVGATTRLYTTFIPKQIRSNCTKMFTQSYNWNGKEAKSDKSKQPVYTLHLYLNKSDPTTPKYSLKAIFKQLSRLILLLHMYFRC